MTTTTIDPEIARASYDAATAQVETATKLLEAARRDHEELLKANEDALDDLERAAELAEAQSRTESLVQTHTAILEAAQRRQRQAALQCLPTVAATYRQQEADAEDAMEKYNQRTEDLLNALEEHTQNQEWRKSENYRRRSNRYQGMMHDAFAAGRAAQFVELVIEGRESELASALDDPKGFPLLQPMLGRYMSSPVGLFASPIKRSTLPPELKAGGIYPLA